MVEIKMSLTSRIKNESIFLKKSIRRKKQNIMTCGKNTKTIKSLNWKILFNKLIVDKKFVNTNTNNKLCLDIVFNNKSERVDLGNPLGI